MKNTSIVDTFLGRSKLKSACAQMLQWLRYCGFHSTQVSHTYSVSQPLSWHVSLSRNRTRKIADIDGYRHELQISLLLWCQLVQTCFNDWGILDSTLHMYPTHIRSANHCHRLSLCQEIGTEKSLKLTFIDTVWRFPCFYAVRLCQTALMIEVFWNLLCTGIPHIFGLPTTVIACVFVKE